MFLLYTSERKTSVIVDEPVDVTESVIAADQFATQSPQHTKRSHPLNTQPQHTKRPNTPNKPQQTSPRNAISNHGM